VFIALLGVVFPLIDRQGWLTLSAAMVLLNIFFPYYYILVYIGDSFAGERERHTLETLLASRISDRAILWGKVVSTVGYIWGMTLVAAMLSMGVVNLAQGRGPWMFYSPFGLWLGVLILSLLACLFSASGGILVSLHSRTTRQAAQTFALGSLGLFMAVYFAARALPPRLFAGLSGSQILFLVILFLAVLDAILLAISMASFHRPRLIMN
jgi:ABC-2 type transport system permease protein